MLQMIGIIFILKALNEFMKKNIATEGVVFNLKSS